MSVTATPSRTVVTSVVGATTDGAGNIISDEAGIQLIGNRGDTILNAIWLVLAKLDTLAAKVHTMSESIQQQVQAVTAQLIADHAAEATSLQQIIAALVPGQTLTQADVDALKAAAAGSHADALQVEAIATGTATASST